MVCDAFETSTKGIELLRTTSGSRTESAYQEKGNTKVRVTNIPLKLHARHLTKTHEYRFIGWYYWSIEDRGVKSLRKCVCLVGG